MTVEAKRIPPIHQRSAEMERFLTGAFWLALTVEVAES
jgi:hypothetical protein